MPRMSEQNRRDVERNQRLAIFDNCISGLDLRRNAQELVNEVVAAMTTPQREQLKKDIAGLNMYNCFAGYYELRPFVDRALTPYGLGIFSKLIMPKYCPDCGYEWDNHNPNCPQFGNDPRAFKLPPSQHKGGRPASGLTTRAADQPRISAEDLEYLENMPLDPNDEGSTAGG